MIKFFIKIIVAMASLVLLIVYGVRNFANRQYPRPTSSFYVNDYADMFGPALNNFLFQESHSLYEDYKHVDQVGGAQIVFVTFKVTDSNEIASFNKTKMFNEWKIGKNNMGVLIVLFFEEMAIEDEQRFNLKEVQIESGRTISERLSTITLNNMVRDTIDIEAPPGDLLYQYDYGLALGVASLMNELLNFMYGNIYYQNNLVIDKGDFLNWYDQYFDNYVYSGSSNMTSPTNGFLYFFSLNGSILDKILFGTFFLAFSLSSGSVIKGGGGSSVGAGLFRRRQ